MVALPADDRSMLRAAFDRYRAHVDAFDYDERTLHGEPHNGNLLATPKGLRWIDLESVCLGPLEWDFAFLDEDATSFFPQVDGELLAHLRVLNSARVAIWCWSRPDRPELRRHAEFHLERVRQAARWPPT
jgi:aminoglycoside phosphotransferase (APT) family kinase protein